MHAYTTLIDSSDLHKNLVNPNWVIVDCRFNLTDTEYGRNEYKKGHIPSAIYAHLDEDLSGAILPGITGRHPLPILEEFIKKIGSWGIDNHVQVIVYDDKFGAIASRLWWLLTYLDHKNVAVLNGGWQDWVKLNYPTEGDISSNRNKEFKAKEHIEKRLNRHEVYKNIESKNKLLIDSRASNRYLGLEEPIDPVAGHIPGAKNLPFMDNLDKEGKFLPKEKLVQRFSSTNAFSQDGPVFYCGSGVTACHNILAYEHAGFQNARLYAGSWSEWIQYSELPKATMKPSRPV